MASSTRLNSRPAAERRPSYTSLAVDEHERAVTPEQPLLSPGFQRRNSRQQTPQQLSSPQLKYVERFGKEQKAPAWVTGAPATGRARRWCGWLLTVIPLAGTAMLLIQVIVHHRPARISLRSPKEMYAYTAPFPEEHPYEPHPIHALMREADRKWEEKVSSQSRTYEDAVKEYRRRNRMSPPRGFDVWSVLEVSIAR